MKLERILLPTDFSPCSLSALQTALGLAAKFSSRIDLVYVLEDLPIFPALSFEHLPTFSSEEFYTRAEEQSRKTLARLLEEKIPSGVRGTIYVHRGSPALEIVQCAKTHRHDVIVMSTHGHKGFKHAVLGSVTEKVVQHATCPVLSARADDETP